MDPLYGRRVLHYLSPVRFVNNVFNNAADSNYNVVERTIQWLPNCHHYVLVPERHGILDNRSNVTLLKYPYPHNAVSNRSQFDADAFLRVVDLNRMDIDFVFTHQPELLYNIMVALSDRRYGEIVHRFSFFHWVDCSISRGSPAIIPGYMRQLEAINLSSKVFMHSPLSVEYLVRNFKREVSVSGLNRTYIMSKLLEMPLSAHALPPPRRPDIPLSEDRPIVVFNHRWNQSTGMNRFLEYTDSLKDQYLFVITDAKAENVPQGYFVVPKPLDGAEYAWLLQRAYALVCFVDGYATWNLSVQDGFGVNKPVLVYNHPIMSKVLGGNSDGSRYPYLFDTQQEFASQLAQLPQTFSWPLVDHDGVFQRQLLDGMIACVATVGDTPKDALSWVWYILRGVSLKSDIANQVQPTIRLNSVWQYIRRWLLNNGVVDDPQCRYTRYSVREDRVKHLTELTKDLQLHLMPKTNKDTVVVRKDHGFWE